MEWCEYAYILKEAGMGRSDKLDFYNINRLLIVYVFNFFLGGGFYKEIDAIHYLPQTITLAFSAEFAGRILARIAYSQLHR